MKLLQSGVDLLTIQAWLGHARVATTHRYATADVEMMRNGLEKAGVTGAELHLNVYVAEASWVWPVRRGQGGSAT